MDRRTIDYLPHWLQEFREIKILCSAHQEQAENLFSAIESIWNNSFIDTLDSIGCERWENMLYIQNKDTYTLEERRSKIAGRMIEQRPFTLQSLKITLDSLCGQGGYTISLNGYTITIKVALSSKNTLQDIDKLTKRIMPANIKCDIALLYNVYSFLSAYTYSELETHTYDSLRNEVL